MVNSCLNLIDDLTKDGIIDKEKEKSDKKEDMLQKKVGKLWDLVNHAVKDDENNQLMDPNNSHRVRDLIKKLNDAIKNQDLNQPKMRHIAKNLSKKIENGEDELAKDLLDFTMNDLEKNGKDNEEIKDLDMDTLATLSKFPGLMKAIMKKADLWNDLKKEYDEPELTHKKRGVLSTLFNNASKNNYNIENMINDDPEGIKNLLKKMINDPVKTLDDGGEEIAEKEVDTLCNILKDRNNYKSLASKNLITDDDINKLEDLYKDLDPKLSEGLKPILDQLKEADKAKKEKEEVLEDEKKIEELEKKVGNCFENHKKALIAYMSNPANETSSSSLLPGKLKIPFDFMKKDSSDIDDKKIPGKLKSPIDTQENKDEKENKNIPGKLKNIPEVNTEEEKK
jgi:ribosomal protein S20